MLLLLLLLLLFSGRRVLPVARTASPSAGPVPFVVDDGAAAQDGENVQAGRGGVAAHPRGRRRRRLQVGAVCVRVTSPDRRRWRRRSMAVAAPEITGSIGGNSNSWLRQGPPPSSKKKPQQQPKKQKNPNQRREIDTPKVAA